MLDAHIVKRRARFTVDVALHVRAGEACGLFGRSGSGKSTILACIAGADVPDAGHVTLDDRTFFPPPLALHRRGIGYLTQDPNLFPHLRVAENVRFGVTGARGTRDAWVAELRDRMELTAIWHESAGAISVGQGRRVALARMLAAQPRLVLLDEPFGGLDRDLVRDLIQAIVAWQQLLGFTMLVVDHQPDVLARLASRAIAIEAGRVIQDASWHDLRADPATPMLAQLIAPL